ncbi:MAG: HD domain-containing protein [Lachnospiraceae bacterium]|nr:HD domain-containing protein [Lachnospiraceae bacterium]
MSRDSILRARVVLIGIAVNVLLSFIAFQLDLTVYLDTVGTIAVASLGGMFPGIFTAVVTDLLCAAFNEEALYFGLVNALIAIFSAWFFKDRKIRKIKNFIIFTAATGIVSGTASALIQWWMLGGPQFSSLRALTTALEHATGHSGFLLFLCLNMVLNMFDKGLSLAAAKGATHFIPDEMKTRIRNGGWRQHPLSVEEVRAMNSVSSHAGYSVKKRMTIVLTGIALALIVIMSGISIRLYYKNLKSERIENAKNAAKFAAEIINPDMIGDYIAFGEEVPDYDETRHMLQSIRENAVGVKYLYVIQVRNDGCHVAFDLDTEDTPAYKPGDIMRVEEALVPYLPMMQKGEEVEPIESNDLTGWIMMAYHPIRDQYDRCVGYVGADVSLSYLAGYMGDFILRVALILSGFFVLILAYAFWMTGIYTAYPINTMALAVESFVRAGADQERLDEIVRKMRAISIRTDDEVERLYHAICSMALNQAEQIRNIRRYSENTARMQDGLIITMADLVESRDSDTGAHVQKTAAYAKIIADGLKKKGYYAEKLTPKFVSDVVRSAPLHDVGKINIPDNVLNKAGKLTDEEYEIIKTHTVVGRKIMEKAISTVEGENYLKEARNMAAYHHERWDGKGYPESLHGEVIPLSARIMAIADVFDALTSPRVYKPAFPIEKAIEMLKEGAGKQFDPKCVEVFIDALPEVKAIAKKYNE